MNGLTALPPWGLALFAAALVPLAVRAFADALERRARARTERLLAPKVRTSA